MAKKQKIEIKDIELTPTVIGVVKKRKNSIIPTILIVGFFVAIIYYLPQIDVFVRSGFNIDAVLNPVVDPNDPTAGNTNTNNNNDLEEPTEVPKVDYTETTVLSTDMMEVSNITFADNKVNFIIKNITEKDIDFNDYDFYLELYTDDTLIQRNSFINIELDSHEEIRVEYDLPDTNINKLRIMEIIEEDYPQVSLTPDSENNTMLSCSKEDNVINYTFSEGKLLAVEEYITLQGTDPNFADNYKVYNEINININEYVGASSTLDVFNDSALFTASFDLLEFTNFHEPEYHYGFNQDSTPNVINFKTETNNQGYTCK